MKSTQILCCDNAAFNQSIGRRCTPKWSGETSLCSRTGEPHEVLKGLVPGTNKFKTAAACPYPEPLCEQWAPILTNSVPLQMGEAKIARQGDLADPGAHDGHNNNYNHDLQNPGGVESLYAALVGESPPPEHYKTHLPKHPGCLACICCKAQRTHRRDKVKERERRRKTTIDLTTPTPKKDQVHEANAPTKFGDSVTSESILVVRNTTNPNIDRTSLSVKDRGTGWIAGYPAWRRTTHNVFESVNDF